MKKDFKIISLKKEFYAKYPKEKYSEMLTKEERPYNCIMTKSEKGYYICIPYRSYINHRLSFRFKNKYGKYRPGLDFTKIIILNDLHFVSDEDVFIDDDQYKETCIHINRIYNDACKYVEDYRLHMLGLKRVKKEVFNRKYQFSTLQYFHNELSIVKTI